MDLGKVNDQNLLFILCRWLAVRLCKKKKKIPSEKPSPRVFATKGLHATMRARISLIFRGGLTRFGACAYRSTFYPFCSTITYHTTVCDIEPLLRRTPLDDTSANTNFSKALRHLAVLLTLGPGLGTRLLGAGTYKKGGGGGHCKNNHYIIANHYNYYLNEISFSMHLRFLFNFFISFHFRNLHPHRPIRGSNHFIYIT